MEESGFHKETSLKREILSMRNTATVNFLCRGVISTQKKGREGGDFKRRKKSLYLRSLLQ